MTVAEPPALIRLLAHPVRWRLVQELARSDRAVRELTRRVDEPQNLVSYHLRQLRDGGVVAARRSSADGRDSYYSLDLGGCREQLRASGGAVHPALALAPSALEDPGPARVLFLCTGNSARSQMAEALLVHLSGGRVDAASAGSAPKPLHPEAVRVMKRRGIDIGGNRTKHLDEYLDERFDQVITLCDRVKEVCPDFPVHRELVHWSMADPSLDGAFERTADELEARIGFLLRVLAERPTPEETNR